MDVFVDNPPSIFARRQGRRCAGLLDLQSAGADDGAVHAARGPKSLRRNRERLMDDRWPENEIIEIRVGENPCGLKRLADTLPGLTDDERTLAPEDVLEHGRPLFVYCSNGLSDRTHGFLFMLERGGVRYSQRTWARARDIIKLTPMNETLKFPPKRAKRR